MGLSFEMLKPKEKAILRQMHWEKAMRLVREILRQKPKVTMIYWLKRWGIMRQTATEILRQRRKVIRMHWEKETVTLMQTDLMKQKDLDWRWLMH